MKSHSFTIVASGLDPEAADFDERFFEAGCDDATLSVQRGLVVLDFEREAKSFAAALVSAIRDVTSTGAKIERVEPDHLVSASEIAKRTGMGRAAISLYANGERGSAFPRPVARVLSESPLWDWGEVAAWMYRRRKVPLGTVVQARLVRETNRLLSTPADAPASRLARQLLRDRRPEQAH